ncbi:hypothetical protein B0T16DRAFT_452009 [Cercophora newfieldiana]|uniref:Uncharacterized protein n=1 Tax=Cercophora newfieldiana TaxID=92897 RepID=A0AA39YPR1_9PEZI|nr:hypothetical protein B0T16DRAFT_452009 [Cercophora newfieldiana]
MAEEQNGIDILCDAAGSDLLGTIHAFPGPSTSASGQQGHHPLVKRARRSPPPSSAHVCHLCKRVYERADHLTRHLRSHENARQYQCSRCPKRFNRADLLTRHEATHDRESDSGRSMIRRTDRTVEACLACAASKAKCDDEKPCSRCRAKDIACERVSKKGTKYRTVDGPSVPPVFDTESHPSDTSEYTITYPGDEPVAAPSNAPSTLFTGMGDHIPPEALPTPTNDEMLFFNPGQTPFLEMDFASWDFWGDLAVPRFGSSSTHSSSSRTAPRGLEDTAKRHAAFKQSPWLWEPENSKNYVQRDLEGLHVDEDQTLPRSSAAAQHLTVWASHLKMTAATRDRLFAIVLAEVKNHARVPSFPSLELLDYLLQANFMHDEYHMCDSWIHAASFDPQDALPELLACIISHGASFIAVPAIWQFGLAVQEIIRLRLIPLFEGNNSNTRRLDCIQTYMLSLDIGIWSGFKRRTELAEGFLLPITTMLRRAGIFTAPPDSDSHIPLSSDSPDVLETKWQNFIKRESYKRVALHLFLHDTQTSISFQKPPLVPFTELNFSPPASRDLWRAPTAEAWRACYLSKPSISVSGDVPLPRVSDLVYSLATIENLAHIIDLDLCHFVLLNGFWSIITAYRASVKFYHRTTPNSTRPLWLDSQKQEIYHDLSNVSSHVSSSPSSNPELALTAELLKMTLHVSLDTLQHFAGKSGEDAARRASLYLETDWMSRPDARYAAWHAGQVLRCARHMPPASLRDFNAMAVYFSALTLWIYFLLYRGEADDTEGGKGHQHQHQYQQQQQRQDIVILDGEETSQTRAYLQMGHGMPRLRDMPFKDGGVGVGVGWLRGGEAEAAGMVLDIARRVLRDNFPVSSEPLPPLVESLSNLLRDLGSSGPGGGFGE